MFYAEKVKISDHVLCRHHGSLRNKPFGNLLVLNQFITVWLELCLFRGALQILYYRRHPGKLIDLYDLW